MTQKKRKKMKPKPVHVEWIDTSSDSYWRSFDGQGDVESNTISQCISSGTILHRDDDRVVVAQTVALDAEGYIQSVSDVMTIPARCVVKIRRK